MRIKQKSHRKHFDRSAPLNNMNELTDMKTMEGILLHSKHVLDQALSPGWAGRFSLSSNVMFVNSPIHVQISHISMCHPLVSGIPKVIIKDCKGIIILTVAEAGFIVSGNVGTGVIIAHKEDGTWSPPSALGLGGIGWGLMAGAEVKDLVICVMDEATLNTFAGEHHMKIGSQVRTLTTESDRASTQHSPLY